MDVQCDADINNTKTQIRFYPDIQNVHLIRDGPFNLQGGGRGGGLSLKKYSDFGGGKKNNLIQNFCHIA
jgi:hypothetical protein